MKTLELLVLNSPTTHHALSFSPMETTKTVTSCVRSEETCLNFPFHAFEAHLQRHRMTITKKHITQHRRENNSKTDF